MGVLGVLGAGRIASGAEVAEEFKAEIQPLLQKHCYECHGSEKKKGGLDLSTYAEYEQVTAAHDVWQTVLERVQAFEMPPEKDRQLKFNEHQRLVKWLRALPKPEMDCDKLASDRTVSFYRGYVMSRRLNRAEYNNTIRDLVGVDLRLDELLPADGGGGEGFDTAGNALFTSTIHIEKYLQAADRVIETVFVGAPGTPQIRQARERILTIRPSDELPAREAARRVLKDFARRAYRRPVTDEEVDRLLGMFDRGWQRGDGFVASVGLALKAVLISPNFLFLAEPEPSQGGIQRLGSLPLASRLSYFIWSSMPDDELLSLAEQDRLQDAEVYRQQVRRMLADPKAGALGERFALQWLDLQRLGTEIRPDPAHFPEFNLDLANSMRTEVTAYFNYIFGENRPLLELIDSDYTFADGKLAGLYGLGELDAAHVRKVSLSDRNRGGLIGMAAVHTMTSYPVRTSPVLRGRWILESLLGEKVKPPPPDVPALEETVSKDAKLSLREQLELHRAKAECASCHDKMDPLGFSMENFDVLGRWRELDRDQPIDAKGTLPSGETVSGPRGLKDVLMQRKENVIRHLVRKMTGFAYGRELNKYDECVIDRAMKALEANDYRAWVLIEEIATSFPFLHRFYPLGL